MDKLSLWLDGLNIDEIYDIFFRQIAGEMLLAKESGEIVGPVSIKDAIERDNMLKKLQKQIDKLETKIMFENSLISK